MKLHWVDSVFSDSRAAQHLLSSLLNSLYNHAWISFILFFTVFLNVLLFFSYLWIYLCCDCFWRSCLSAAKHLWLFVNTSNESSVTTGSAEKNLRLSSCTIYFCVFLCSCQTYRCFCLLLFFVKRSACDVDRFCKYSTVYSYPYVRRFIFMFPVWPPQIKLQAGLRVYSAESQWFTG